MAGMVSRISRNTLRIDRIILNLFIAQISRSLSHGFLSEALSQSVSMIKFILFALYLVPADLANAKLITSIGGFIFLVSSMGTPSYILRQKLIKNEVLNRLFTFSMQIACILILVSLIFSFYLFPELDKEMILYNYFWIVALVVVSLLEIIHLTLIQRRIDARRFAVARNIKSLSGLLLAYIFLVLDASFYAIVISSIGSITISWLYCSVYSRCRISLATPDKNILGPLKFSGVLGCANIMSFGSNHLIPLLLIYFFDEDLAGYYILAVGLANIVSSIFLYPLHFMLVPIVRKQQENYLIESVFSLLRIQSVIIAPVFMLSIFAAPTIYSMLDTTKWQFSIELFGILMISQVARCLLLPSNDIFISKGVPVLSLIAAIKRLCMYLGVVASCVVTEAPFTDCVWGFVLSDIFLMAVMNIGAIWVASNRRAHDARLVLVLFLKNAALLFVTYKFIELFMQNLTFSLQNLCFSLIVFLFFGLIANREWKEFSGARNNS